MALGRNLKKFREEANLTQEDLSELTGGKVSQGAITALETRDSKTSMFTAELAKALNLTTDELISGTRSREKDIIHEKQGYKTASLVNNIDLPQFDITGSMGYGSAQPDGESIVALISVTRDWVRSVLPAISGAHNLKIMTGHGDSMEGTFRDGDLLIIDIGVKEVRIDAVYVLALNDELYVKRLQRRPDGSILMISDNKKYEPCLIQNGEREKFQVLGRVVLAWNANKL